MKKVVAIMLSLFMLVSGLHLTLATHICGGKVAAVKWSMSGNTASCGMKKMASDVSTGMHLQSNCCHDEVAALAVDSSYAPSDHQSVSWSKSLIEIFYLPASFGNLIVTPFRFLDTNLDPPQRTALTAVSLAMICVFRN